MLLLSAGVSVRDPCSVPQAQQAFQKFKIPDFLFEIKIQTLGPAAAVLVDCALFWHTTSIRVSLSASSLCDAKAN